ncbi:MAG: hypothetical protein ACFB0B_04795 [Thermonemataceae bacterium]
MEKLPYRQIPATPDTYTPGNVAARMIDALGFRYYWATEGLRAEDFDYKPSTNARTTRETLDHIDGLVIYINNAVKKQTNFRKTKEKTLFSVQRKQTLLLLKEASDLLRQSSAEEIENFTMIFDGREKAYPFWNILNGPVADALWHVGQVVTFRRASGNPIDSQVNMLLGKRKE